MWEARKKTLPPNDFSRTNVGSAEKWKEV